MNTPPSKLNTFDMERLGQRMPTGIIAPPTPYFVQPALDETLNCEYQYGRKKLHLSEAATTALRSFLRDFNLTLGTLVQRAWSLLLSRISGEDTVVFWIADACHCYGLDEINPCAGALGNVSLVRVYVHAQESVGEWLKNLLVDRREAHTQECTPFQDLREWIGTAKCQPLFESILRVDGWQPHFAHCAQSLTCEKYNSGDLVQPVFNLALCVKDVGHELLLKITYDRQDFEDEVVARMVGHFQTILEGIVGNPAQPIAELPLLAAAERHQLLVEWNQTGSQYPRDRCVHHLFEAQAALTPDAVAVVCGEQRVTYRELNRRANQLAHHLRGRGVGSESLVGICVSRSIELVVAVVGILKAGGAYVPLDASYPPQRLGWMMKDAGVAVLVTERDLASQLPTEGTAVVCVDVDRRLIGGEHEENPQSGATAESLAYVIYTSGSTGTPKGVAVPHRAISRLILNTNYIELNSSDKVAQASNPSFDAATFEIWGALLHGAQLVFVAKETILSHEELAAQIREHGITTIFLTTALFNQIAREAPSTFRGVRHLLFGGEMVNPECVRRVLNSDPPQRLLHLYGPTESTTFASWHLVQDVPEGATNIPIGRPISNTQIYLLDRYRQLVPVGVAGELYIGGDGLAHGYLNQEELTAEKFIPDPFSDEANARLYRSGDLARFLPDGSIEFLGRIDQQVKIRGHRIEPGEIEAALSSHPAVRESVVIAKEDRPGENHLVAYVVADQERAPRLVDLRNFLQERLPEYMVPAAFLQLDELPLTPNGKVDHPALAEMNALRPCLPIVHVEPRTEIEHVTAEIFRESLQIESVGIHDNFFDLGAHSLLIARIHGRLQQLLKTQFPIVKMYQHPTVVALTEYLTSGQSEQPSLQKIYERAQKQQAMLARRKQFTKGRN